MEVYFYQFLTSALITGLWLKFLYGHFLTEQLQITIRLEPEWAPDIWQ